MFTIEFRGGLSAPGRSGPVGLSSRWLRRALVALAGVAVVCGSIADAAAAEKLSAADRQAIERTVRMQLDAFGHDDADRAFRFAAPEVQRMFGSSDSFMDMVRDHYEPVYHASSARFLRAEMVDNQWVQPVQITDGEGHVWRALFTMRRQADKSWKVGGCELLETSAIET
jgi:hypothetical protein